MNDHVGRESACGQEMGNNEFSWSGLIEYLDLFLQTLSHKVGGPWPLGPPSPPLMNEFCSVYSLVGRYRGGSHYRAFLVTPLGSKIVLSPSNYK